MTATNRLAFLRYIVIDECLVQATRQNPTLDDADDAPGKLLHKQDLLAAVNARIAEFSEHTKPIAMRTLEKDLVDVQNLFGVKILKLSHNRRAHYRYAQVGMSIRDAALSADHALALQQLFKQLELFRLAPGQEWWWEAESRLRVHFDLFPEEVQARSSHRLVKSVKGAEVFKNHRWPDAGRKWLPALAKVGSKSTPIRLAYRLDHDGPLVHTTCRAEWLTRQQETWMVGVSAWDEEAEEIFRMLIPLNAIDSLDDVTAQFSTELAAAPHWDWPQYAEHRIGLEAGVIESNPGSPEHVQVWLSEALAKRYLVDPIHPSQDLRLQKAAGGVLFSLNLVVDSSLLRWILQWGSEAQLLEPAEGRHALRVMAQEMAALYEPMFGP
tara:strand:- start:467 stop:1612 length:1146 start_codon:yes stop_codon:yes gene_type:complete